MRDVHSFEGKKQYVEDLETGIDLVREKYPTALKE